MAQHDGAPLADVLAEVVADADTKALFRQLQQALNELIDSELTAAIGAAQHERTESRTNQRNGGRSKTLSTPAGDVEHEWQVADRAWFSEHSMAQLGAIIDNDPKEVTGDTQPALPAA